MVDTADMNNERLGTRPWPRVPRVAVSGCGPWGRNLVRVFQALGALVAINDVDGKVAEQTARTHGVPSRAFRELLRDPELDAIVVATPAVEHARLAGDALAAGKHVFVEKPLALTVADAEALCDLAEGSNRVLMVGHLVQYHPAFAALEALVSEGTLGRLQYMYSSRLNFGRIRREESILWSFAPHDISMMLRLAMSDPTSVTAVAASFLHERIPDVTTTHLSFESGVRGHVFVSWLHPFKEQKLVVIGDRGMAVFDDGQPWEAKLQHYPHQVAWRGGVPQPTKANPVPIIVDRNEPLLLECEHFLSCILTGTTPRTDGREGVRVLRVIECADRAMSTTSAMTTMPSATIPSSSSAPAVFIHESAYVEQPFEIGEGTKIWHFSHVMARSRLGRNCVLGQNVMVGPEVTIGNNCKIQNNVSIYRGVTLEDDVFCGPSAVFTNVLTPRAHVDRKEEFLPTRVQRGASIGANATIVCGHNIGPYSFVAAGAVVTSDVLPHALVAGVPARQVGWVSHDGERLGPDLICPRSGRRYRETAAGTLEELDGADHHVRQGGGIRLLDLTAQRRELGGEIERAITKVLDHERFIMGPEVEALEERLAGACGASYAVSCASGTDALLLVLLAWGIGHGDAVFLPSFSFASTAEVVALLGATPFFVDVCEDSFNMDPASLQASLEAVRKCPLNPKAVIAVDLFGQPADYDAIGPVADAQGLRVLADAAQSFGASLGRRFVGTLAHATATSFFPSKPLGCYGDGGAVLTDDPDLASTVRSLRMHGKGRDKYDCERVGLNSRLDTLQAAVLLAKLNVFRRELDKRERIADVYAKELSDIVAVPTIRAGAKSAWAQYTIRTDRRDEIRPRLSDAGVPTATYYPRPLHKQKAYTAYPAAPSGLDVSETLARQVLSLPLQPHLAPSAQKVVVEAVRAALRP